MKYRFQKDVRGRAKKYADSYKRRMVHLYNAGDLSRPEFCHKHSLAYTTFSHWVSVFRGEAESCSIMDKKSGFVSRKGNKELELKEVELSNLGGLSFIHMRLCSGHELRIPSGLIRELPNLIKELEKNDVNA